VPPSEIVTSAKAAAEYDVAVEGWGERGWSSVARICRQVEAWEPGRQLPFECPSARVR
jgi:hypothetical protein